MKKVDRTERRARWNRLALALFNLETQLVAVSREARSANAETILGEAGFWRVKAREWRRRIDDALAGTR